jgi:hypothetical protein
MMTKRCMTRRGRKLPERIEMATQLATTDERPAPMVSLSPEAEKFSLMQRQAQLFASSPLIPAHLRAGSPQQAMANCYIAMTIADKMGEDRMTVMQNIHVVHGAAGFKASYMIARANASGKFRDTIDWEVTGKGRDLSVTAFATLASTGRRVEFTVDMAMAEAEGWTKNPKYKSLPELMLRYRSGTFLVRLYAPEVMLGYQTAEEVEDVVLSASPAQPPLTAQMLVDQSQPEEADSDGERTAPAPEASEEGPAQGTDTMGDQIGLDDEHPAQAKADAIIAELNADECNAILDVAAVLNRHAADIAAMPEAMGASIEIAADKKRQAIRAAQKDD